MNEIRKAIHTALRDDDEALVGIRALLGHSTDPFGVNYHHLPDKLDFSTLSFLTWFFLSATPQDDNTGFDVNTKSLILSVTAWSRLPDTVATVLKRVDSTLVDLRRVTIPTTDEELHGIKNAGSGPDLFDNDYKAYYRRDTYQVWYRQDHAN